MAEHEQVAEILAFEATRTLGAAREAVAQARKDRGFGRPGSIAATKAGGPCFKRGGPHQMKDCPDRNAPKGKGKGAYYA